MKIDRVELREVALRLKDPFATSFGELQGRRILLVQLEGEGAEGWGECAADDVPDYSYETVDTAWLVLTRFAVPALLSDPLTDPADLAPRLAVIRGHPMAKAALEGAVWDLFAKAEGIPLWKRLEGARQRVPAGVSIGLQPSIAELLEQVERFLGEGYRRIKVKIAPGRDLEPLEAVRRRWPQAPLTADANGAYLLEDAPALQRLDALRLEYLEQPLAFDDLYEHARLAELIETPICLDESIRHARDAVVALETGAAGVINLKVGRVGGLREALAVHEACLDRAAPLWCGGMLESGIGRAHNVALATLPGFTLPGDLSGSDRYWEGPDLVDPPWTLHDGHLEAPDAPGIGVEVDRGRLDSVTLRRDVIG